MHSHLTYSLNLCPRGRAASLDLLSKIQTVLFVLARRPQAGLLLWVNYTIQHTWLISTFDSVKWKTCSAAYKESCSNTEFCRKLLLNLHGPGPGGKKNCSAPRTECRSQQPVPSDNYSIHELHLGKLIYLSPYPEPLLEYRMYCTESIKRMKGYSLSIKKTSQMITLGIYHPEFFSNFDGTFSVI